CRPGSTRPRCSPGRSISSSGWTAHWPRNRRNRPRQPARRAARRHARRTRVDVAKPALIFRAGGLAAAIMDLAARAGGPRIVGFVIDRDGNATAATGLPLHRWPEMADRAGEYVGINGIGSPARRAFIETAEAHGFEFVTLVDPSAQIFPSARIGPGT